MKALLFVSLIASAHTGLAKDLRSVNSMCNVYTSGSYHAEKKCRTDDVMIGADIQNGVLILECSRLLVLCNNAAKQSKDSPLPIKIQIDQDGNSGD